MRSVGLLFHIQNRIIYYWSYLVPFIDVLYIIVPQ